VWIVTQMQRLKVLSDLLISISKAERQEARTKVRQESLRLGNVGVIRYLLKVFAFLFSGRYDCKPALSKTHEIKSNFFNFCTMCSLARVCSHPCCGIVLYLWFHLKLPSFILTLQPFIVPMLLVRNHELAVR